MKQLRYGIVLLILNVLSIVLIFRSIGWIFLMSAIILIPAIIFNSVISYWSNRVLNQDKYKILIPSILFLFYSIIRIDMDDYGMYIGITSFLSMIGFSDLCYIEQLKYTNILLGLNAITVLGMIIYDFLLLKRIKQMKNKL